MVHSHKWTHPAIIPHIPTNKPSSAEVSFGQPLKQSCLQMQWMLRSFSLLLHKSRKRLSETIFGIISRENIRVQQMIQILFKREF